MNITAITTAIGSDSYYPEDENAVDAMINLGDRFLGCVTLRPNDEGDLDTWGSLDHWADSELLEWLSCHDSDELADVVSDIVASVRKNAHDLLRCMNAAQRMS